MRSRGMCAGFLATLAAVGVCHGEGFKGLELDFERRDVAVRVTLDDLEDAYRIDPDGAIRMLAKPSVSPVDERNLVVSIAPGKRKTGVLRVTLNGGSAEVQVARDNSLTGLSRLSGLPFGYAFLPPEGSAEEGESWEEVMVPQEGSGGPRVAATFRYTLTGKAPSDDCPDCVEIRIVGLRRFEPDRSLSSMLAGLFSEPDDSFYTADQVFAIGTVLFSPRQRFFHRFELGMNTSMLTPLAVPGMMRRVVVEVLQ